MEAISRVTCDGCQRDTVTIFEYETRTEELHNAGWVKVDLKGEDMGKPVEFNGWLCTVCQIARGVG